MSEFADAMEDASSHEHFVDKLNEEIDALKKANERLKKEASSWKATAEQAVGVGRATAFTLADIGSESSEVLRKDRDRAIATAEALKVELEEQQAYAVALQKQIESQSLLLQVAGRRMARLEKQLTPPEPQKP